MWASENDYRNKGTTPRLHRSVDYTRNRSSNYLLRGARLHPTMVPMVMSYRIRNQTLPDGPNIKPRAESSAARITTSSTTSFAAREYS